MPHKKKPRSTKTDTHVPRKNSFKTDSGELWIEPDLNRKVAGPGGNRGDHTTSSAELLTLADLALKKNA